MRDCVLKFIGSVIRSRAAVALGVFGAAMSLATTSFAADAFKLDAAHSMAIFKVSHLGVSNVLGRINDPTGTFTIDDGDISKSSFDVTFNTENIDTHVDARDKHLKGADFFNAKQFPTITFKSTSVKKIDETHLEVTGDLTLHGVTKPLTITVNRIGTAKDQRGTVRSGVDAAFTIKRSDFGMNFMLGPSGVGDDIMLMVNLEGVKE